MPYCIAKFCKMSDKNNTGNIHFHRFPKDRSLQRHWLAKCGRPGGGDKQARVCSLHFAKDDYENMGRFEQGFATRPILKRTAVPRIFAQPDAQFIVDAEETPRSRRRMRRITKQVGASWSITCIVYMVLC